MSHPSKHIATTKVTRFVPGASLAMGAVGAVIGGTAAGAKNIRRVNAQEITREEAVRDTFKEAAGTGLAVSAATAVVGAVGATGLLSLVGIAAVATGAKYLWDSAISPVKIPAPAPAPEPEVKQTASKKTARTKK